MCDSRDRASNPFAPPVTDEPAADQAGPARALRSVVPRVFGVLSITFASLMLLVFLFVALGAIMASPKEKPPGMPVAEQLPSSPSTQPALGGGSVDRSGGSSADRSGGTAESSLGSSPSPEPVAAGVLAAVVGLMFMLLTPALLVIGIGQVRYRRWAAKPTVVWAVAALATMACLLAMVVLAGRDASGRPMLTAIPTIVFLVPYPVLLLVFFSRQHTVASMDEPARGPSMAVPPARSAQR